ncbi:MAG TPA: PASTA domain-containing protein [Acidobacteriaceae bacterium]|nr:PASTA domain-containing protein [Acidobacteriaceae bacterium]
MYQAVPMLGIFRALSAVLLLVMIALLSALITMRLAIHGAEVQVPALRGRTVPQTFVELRAKGLQAGIDGHYFSATQPAGVVLTQRPAPGTLVRKSWRVRVTVSLGPQKVAIPSVDGMNETIATITIRRTGLQVGTVVGLPYAYAPENTVIAQTPTGNATDVEGPRVSILTAHPSLPPENASVMPDMIGENFTQAALAIIHAGFKLAPLQNAPTEASPSTPTGQPPASLPVSPAPATPAASAPPGAVIAQIPAAGTRIPAGSTIQLTVQP